MIEMPRSRASVEEEKTTGLPSRMISPEVGCTTPDRIFIKRRLAGAVLAEQRRDLAAVDVEVDALQRMDAAIGLGDVAGGEDDLAGRRVGGGRRRSFDCDLHRRDEPVLRVDQREGADDLDRSCRGGRRVDAGEHRLLHRVIDGRPGILILDLVLEAAELDVAGRVAQVRAVDRRAGLDADPVSAAGPRPSCRRRPTCLRRRRRSSLTGMTAPIAARVPYCFAAAALSATTAAAESRRRRPPLLDDGLDLRELFGAEGLRRERLLANVLLGADPDDLGVEGDRRKRPTPLRRSTMKSPRRGLASAFGVGAGTACSVA